MSILIRSMRPVFTCLVNSRRRDIPLCSTNLCRYLSNGKSNDDGNDSDKPSMRQKFIPFDESKPEEILDYHEEQFGFRWDEKHQLIDDDLYVFRKKRRPTERAKQVQMERGVTGVFDIEGIVEVLRGEKMNDICVIKIPRHFNYCDYLVLATGRSPKQLTAVVAYIRKLYKMIKLPSDPFLKGTIGEDTNWRIIDMNSIVVHLFLPDVREVYDIESLWCVGAELDEKTINPEYSQVLSQLEKHIKFLEELQPELP